MADPNAITRDNTVTQKRKKTRPEIHSFKFKKGDELCNKYVIEGLLGAGFESEVYRIIEKSTGIERAAKLYFPQQNQGNKIATRYAKLLHKLSNCPIVIHYHTHETIKYQDQKVTCLISEYVEGVKLSTFLKRQPGKYIGVFRGLQLLHALVTGLESMHNLSIAHGDIHADNIIVKRYGLGFELKLLDMYRWKGVYRKTMADDICDSIRVFYDAIGGRKRYRLHPIEIKQICLGLKTSLILNKFPSAAHLRDYLENIEWKSSYRE
ncbi:MAG: protein kinase [Gammaproteobacteria bacterium]|nr:protein kinase [Gammaproteobacteria bacterium]